MLRSEVKPNFLGGASTSRCLAIHSPLSNSQCLKQKSHALYISYKSRRVLCKAKDDGPGIEDAKDIVKSEHKNFVSWMQGVPRFRVRKPEKRCMDQLLELTVVNERLAGAQPWEIRQKVEYLKKRQYNWELIYHYLVKKEAAATLKLIEEANKKVEEALSENSRESQSLGSLKNKLVELQEEINDAHEKLHMTELRVKHNVERIKELKREADSLEKIKDKFPGSEIISNEEKVNEKEIKQKLGRTDLKSQMDIEDGLKNYWYPIEFSSKVKDDLMVPFELMDEPWVLFRDENGKVACIRDECAHRACPISIGKVSNGRAVCPYHGWEYDKEGSCVKMPSTLFNKDISVSTLPVYEKDGFVWVWPGPASPTQVPDFTRPPKSYQIHAEIEVLVPVEHGLLMENLLDLAHAPFTHTNTFAKGWPIPDIVRFNSTQSSKGHWDPYPIDMSFEPPCMVVSIIGLARAGKILRGQKASSCERHLHQLHVCLPNKRGQVRLLYRMSLDFMHWAKWIPGAETLWRGVANQVLGEDLVLIKGQQDRMLKGGDTWAHPVSYDKLAVHYRHWRNAVDKNITNPN